jgi:hypothetical protein
MLVAAEVLARNMAGNPPLTMAHPATEYMFRPNQDVTRFGNRFFVNELGMRSTALPKDGREIVLVFGDSVVNGGVLTDQSKIATEVSSNRQIFFANISAGSWGPGNILGYIDTYGFLGAKTALYVMSSHDLNDQPTCEPLNLGSHPSEAPVSVLFDLFIRYVPRYAPQAGAELLQRFTGQSGPKPDCLPSGRSGLDDIMSIIERTRQAGLKTCLIAHSTIKEIESGRPTELDVFISTYINRFIPIVRLSDLIISGESNIRVAFRDDIHLSDKGQGYLATALSRCRDMAT